MGNKYQKSLSVAIMVYILFFSAYSVLMHHSYLTSAYDLGIFMQSLWTTAYGYGFLFNTPEWEDLGVYSHFGVHNSPILLLLVPIYRGLPYAETLLLLQTIILGLGALAIFKFARLLVGDREAFYISLIYLANPLIHGINRFDFHPVSLVVPLIFLIPYYYEQNEYLKMILVSLLVLTAKEDSGLILISLGGFFIVKKYGLRRALNPVWLLKNHKDIFVEISLVFLGLIWILLSLFIVIPHYNGGMYPYIDPSRVQRYSMSISDFHVDYVLVFFSITIISLAFIPLLNLSYFMTSLPLWLELILPSKTVYMVRVGYQYPYMLVPFLIIITVYAVQSRTKNNLLRILNKDINIKALLGFAVISMVLFSPAMHVVESKYIAGVPVYTLGGVYTKWSSYFWVLNNVTLTISTSSCSIATQNSIFPHIANRYNVYCLRTFFNASYLPNNSIVLLASSLPDYQFTIKSLQNSTLTANKTYFILNVNDIILKCYNQTGDNTKQFNECITNYTEAIIQKCEWAMSHAGKR
ncbi:conserved membrane protein of unknown function [Thermococcus nautili]|uniref:DUF2079 domain-containing protein n=1 Tax=Thermococcus nautili TaxID=195522 RepID=UPI002556AED3|nr:DUF2079 domain-containing protein [Thermococcus nautili]CAI1493913.1 conserved membrane protein of unknown function [Thermococcus nautili]